MGREISAEAVRNQTFGKPPLGQRGYSEDEVDAYLQLIAAALDGRSRLSADNVHNVAFKKPHLGRRGYDEGQVDEFLDAIADQLRARERSPGDAWAAANAAWHEAKFGGGRSVPSRTEAESATRRTRRRGWGIRARHWLLAAMSLVAFGLMAWFVPDGQSGGSGTGGSSGTDDPMRRLTTGVCFNLSDTQFATVPCAQPHQNEAYFRYGFPPGPFPGDQSVNNAPMSACDAHLDGYVGPGHAAEFFDWPLAPDKSEWAAGIHYTVCVLSPADNGKTTGSAHTTITVHTTITANATPTKVVPTHTATARALNDGRYLVGSEIRPGTYHTDGNPDPNKLCEGGVDATCGCSYTRLSNLSGDPRAIIASNLFISGPTTIEVERTDKALQLFGGCEWKKIG